MLLISNQHSYYVLLLATRCKSDILVFNGTSLCTDKQRKVAGIVPAIEKARLYRGKGGEIMRAAVSQFIECISLSHLLVPKKIIRSLLDTLSENLRHPNSQIQVSVSWKRISGN